MREDSGVREDSDRRAGSFTGALAEAFVGLADSLIDDYDVAELSHRLIEHCVALLPISAAGILLSDQQDVLRATSASTEQTRNILQFQLDVGEGPTIECFRTGQEVAVVDLLDDGNGWANFGAQAYEIGFRAVHAVPLRLRAQTIGALTLFRTEPGPLPAEDIGIGRALVDVATIGILQERAVSQRTMLVDQLQFALNSRVIIEQAKGILAERNKVDMGEAFTMLRGHARNHNRRLSEVAAGVVDGTVVLGSVAIDAGVDTDSES